MRYGNRSLSPIASVVPDHLLIGGIEVVPVVICFHEASGLPNKCRYRPDNETDFEAEHIDEVQYNVTITTVKLTLR